MILTKLPFNIDLSNKVVVVTGGTGVLGGQFVDALAACGAKVAVLARKLESAGKVGEVERNGGIAIGVRGNVMNKENLKAAHDVIREKFGPTDILINAAGGNHPKGQTTKEYLFAEDIIEKHDDTITFFDLEAEGVQSVFNLNFLGTLLPSQEFASDMVNRPGATIINISSMSAFTPLTKVPAYSGAKAAVNNFIQWLAVHMSKVGIRVNAIAPGFS